MVLSGRPRASNSLTAQVAKVILQTRCLKGTYSLHCSSFLGLPFRILHLELVKPKKGTTIETIGQYAPSGCRPHSSELYSSGPALLIPPAIALTVQQHPSSQIHNPRGSAHSEIPRPQRKQKPQLRVVDFELPEQGTLVCTIWGCGCLFRFRLGFRVSGSSKWCNTDHMQGFRRKRGVYGCV